jgi:hypothetical protein
MGKHDKPGSGQQPKGDDKWDRKIPPKDPPKPPPDKK